MHSELDRGHMWILHGSVCQGARYGGKSVFRRGCMVTPLPRIGASASDGGSNEESVEERALALLDFGLERLDKYLIDTSNEFLSVRGWYHEPKEGSFELKG